jgi:hypothetical protein
MILENIHSNLRFLEISRYAQIFWNFHRKLNFWKFHSMLRFSELSQEAQFIENFTVISDIWKFNSMLRFLELSQQVKNSHRNQKNIR